jgi:hypothetical protein
MTNKDLEHTFRTSHSLDRLGAILTKVCRTPCRMEVEAHDPNMIPAYRIVCVTFATVEDRDRFRIALRLWEKEAAAAAARTPQPRAMPPRIAAVG